MNQWPETSESLIERLRDVQDAAAWEHFLAVYRPIVLRLAVSRGVHWHDAEDLAQGVFQSVSQAVAKWIGDENGPRFRNWLGRIARNAILNELTRSHRDKAAGSSSVATLLREMPEREQGLTDDVLKESRIAAFHWAACQVRPEFSDATWTMFDETAVRGHAASDVAARLGKSAGAVYVARCRVMHRIREKLMEFSDLWGVES